MLWTQLFHFDTSKEVVWQNLPPPWELGWTGFFFNKNKSCGPQESHRDTSICPPIICMSICPSIDKKVDLVIRLEFEEEEHVCVTQFFWILWPKFHLSSKSGCVYLGCVIPYSGHGISINVALSQLAKVHGWDPHTTVISADGTNTIVGSNNGATPYFEKLPGHSVHWNICLLYGNELPFWALFADYDG